VTLTVLQTGPLALVQDLGRPGLAHLGVGPSGAADRGALRRGNRLVGSPEGAAGIEVLLGGLSVRTDANHLVAVTGAPGPVTVDGRPEGHSTLVRLHRGQTLSIGVPPRGLRSYLAVRGGIAVPPVLGSRSYDVLARLGPPPLQEGDALPVGTETDPLPDTDLAPLHPEDTRLPLLPGPRTDWLDGGLAALATTWTVATDSDRIALRLHGPRLTRRQQELPSEGLLPGAVQLPPDGQPVLFLADAPVTGGYPVVAVVPRAALDRAGQLRPGERVRMTSVITTR
jgi:biotin-dependent carboxylase-like uncharacterized protein